MLPTPSVQSIHEKALQREPLTIVYFGGSLTWGANASDPQLTSYRGLMTTWLREKYPRTPITFYDAAIGGTGSQLGIFRVERDVISRKPDLVFLDFTVNDNADGRDRQSLAAYEQIVRELLAQGTMVVPVLTMFKTHAENPDAPIPARHRAHLQLAEAYGLPAADIMPYVRQKVKSGADIKTLWPFDGAHPDDAGYQLFFEAVRDRYESAIMEAKPATPPAAPIYEPLYAKRDRYILVDHPLPEGWKREKTWRTGLWFDGLASRWMGDVAVASAKSPGAPIELEFEGSVVGFFGERNGLSPALKIWIDDQPMQMPKAAEGDYLWPLTSARFSPPRKGSGCLFIWQLISNTLKEGKHKLRIEPQWEGADPDAEVRIESICSAGK